MAIKIPAKDLFEPSDGSPVRQRCRKCGRWFDQCKYFVGDRGQSTFTCWFCRKSSNRSVCYLSSGGAGVALFLANTLTLPGSTREGERETLPYVVFLLVYPGGRGYLKLKLILLFVIRKGASSSNSASKHNNSKPSSSSKSSNSKASNSRHSNSDSSRPRPCPCRCKCV